MAADSPFANGKGRTASVRANWAGLRYAPPPLCGCARARGPACAAAYALMRGDHARAIGVFRQQLAGLLDEPS